MVTNNEKPVLYCKTQDAWQDWLAKNGASSPGVRLQLVKKSSSLRA